MKHYPSLWNERPMYVQNLFNLKLNVAADVKQTSVTTFQRCCRISIEELSNKTQTEIINKNLSQSVCNLTTSSIKTVSTINTSSSLSTLNESGLENGKELVNCYSFYWLLY